MPARPSSFALGCLWPPMSKPARSVIPEPNAGLRPDARFDQRGHDKYTTSSSRTHQGPSLGPCYSTSNHRTARLLTKPPPRKRIDAIYIGVTTTINALRAFARFWC